MKAVVLYFPYMINLKAFVATEKLKNVIIDPADLFLKTTLNEAQIKKACLSYGAVLGRTTQLQIRITHPNKLLNQLGLTISVYILQL